MTRLLLDTHAYVWAITAPARLGDDAATLIRDATNELYVSAASVWEMSIKHRGGKWPEVEPLLASHDRLIARLGAGSLDVSWQHARRAGGLRWGHRDPFDRMLVAQALSEDLTLVSRDEIMRQVPGLSVVWGGP